MIERLKKFISGIGQPNDDSLCTLVHDTHMHITRAYNSDFHKIPNPTADDLENIKRDLTIALQRIRHIELLTH